MKGNVVVLLVAVAVLGGGFIVMNRTADTDFDAMPETEGLHYHPILEIYINDEPYLVPANIGITVGDNKDHDVSGMHMSPIHTHDLSGTLHMEQASPRDDALTLGYFFDVWNVEFSEECLIDWCTDEAHEVKMFVNDERNYEYGSYKMKDGDRIVLRYEERGAGSPLLN